MSAWSMKKDRDLISLVRANLSLDKIAAKLETSPAGVAKAAKRLGLSLGPQPVKRDGRLKAKAE
jgi:hypothetical protein